MTARSRGTLVVLALACLAVALAACGSTSDQSGAGGGPAAAEVGAAPAASATGAAPSESPGQPGEESGGPSSPPVEDDGSGGGGGDGDKPVGGGDADRSAAPVWHATGLETRESLALPSGEATAANGVWLIVHLRIENRGGQDLTVTPADLELQDWEDQLYPVSADGLLAVKGPLLAGTVIPAGKVGKAAVVFDVPQRASHGTEIVVTGASAGDEGEIRFPISR